MQSSRGCPISLSRCMLAAIGAALQVVNSVPSLRAGDSIAVLNWVCLARCVRWWVLNCVYWVLLIRLTLWFNGARWSLVPLRCRVRWHLSWSATT